MIQFLNNVLNKTFRFLLVINLTIFLIIWSLMYPFLRYRWKLHKRRTYDYYYDYEKHPSNLLLKMYERASNFWDRFIF